MNGNDLMNALSGLDPKYIDEAAFELHGKPQVTSGKGSEVIKRKTSVTGFRKYLPIVLPAAAAILLTVAVAMPMILRFRGGGFSSSTAPKSESAGSVEAPSSYADEPAASYDAEAPALDTSPSYSDGETAGYSEYSAEAEVTEDSMSEDAALNAAAETAETGTEAAKTAWALTGATYYEGFLILHTDGALPEGLEELTYTVGESGGAETVLADGVLGDVLMNTEPITLDLTGLELPSGSYILSIGDESIDFAVE